MSFLCTLQLQCRVKTRLTECLCLLQWLLPLREWDLMLQLCCMIGHLKWQVQRHQKACSCHKLQWGHCKEDNSKLWHEGQPDKSPAVSVVQR